MEQGGDRPSGRDFQAVAGGLQGQADEPRLRPEDPRSSEPSPGCWRCGGSCRWSNQPALLLTSPSPPHRGTTARRSPRGQGLFGQLSSVAGVCVCGGRGGGCLRVTQGGPHASSRGSSIMEIVSWSSGGTGSHSKLALEYFELAVMKANGNLLCLQA